MPTINFSLNDLSRLVGRKISLTQLGSLLDYCKASLEGYNKESDEVTVNLEDTNLPYLWSVEGISRLIKGVIGREKGIPRLKLNAGPYKIFVDRSVTKVRPYIAAFVAKGKKVDDYLIKQMVQLQEKLCENYGRRRDKVAVGIYSYDKISFPVHYRAVDPDSIKFTPLDSRKEMSLAVILREHPKGIAYRHLLENFSKYPLLVDEKGAVLSFPPIINSDWTGKVKPKDEHLFVEATGTDLDSVLLAVNILAQAFHDRGFQIYSVDIKYPTRKITTPHSFNQSVKLSKEQFTSLIGVELSDAEFKRLLEKARYDYSGGKVFVPSYRCDIMHPVDVIEDIAIVYGFNRIPEKPLTSYTPGSTAPITKFINNLRELLVGFGLQEVMSPMLINKRALSDMMNTSDFGTVEIEHYSSETYSVVRSWLLPVLMGFLSKNKHVEYPQRVFEEGIVTVRKGNDAADCSKVAVAIAEEAADYTRIRQLLDNLLLSLGFDYSVEEAEHDSFIPGRVARIIVNGKEIAFVGELHPRVLSNFEIEVPVAAFELNLTELFEALKAAK